MRVRRLNVRTKARKIVHEREINRCDEVTVSGHLKFHVRQLTWAQSRSIRPPEVCAEEAAWLHCAEKAVWLHCAKEAAWLQLGGYLDTPQRLCNDGVD